MYAWLLPVRASICATRYVVRNLKFMIVILCLRSRMGLYVGRPIGRTNITGNDDLYLNPTSDLKPIVVSALTNS